MSKYIQWITHRGKPILFVNGVGLAEVDYLAALEEMKQELLRHPEGSLCLLDTTGAKSTSLVANAKAREVAATMMTRGIPERATAMVGLNSTQRAIANMVNLSSGMKGRMYFAKNLEEAKDWLVQQ